MLSGRVYSITDVRRMFREAGFNIEVKRYSCFKSIVVKHPDGTTMPSIYTGDLIEKFEGALDVIEKIHKTGRVMDGCFTVTI